ncbi:MAG: hypothetical protein M1832_000554 [Thelocarpon impressellum]|nr:MAG: hypothetical protein M1832_000554 [Thelocarpon impressellum]
MLPLSSLQAALVASLVASHVAAGPVFRVPSSAANAGMRGECRYTLTPHGSISARLEFYVGMKGFGSLYGRPGGRLFDGLRSPERGSLRVNVSSAAFSYPEKTLAELHFSIAPATAAVADAVEGAIKEASDGLVAVECGRYTELGYVGGIPDPPGYASSSSAPAPTPTGTGVPVFDK